MRIAITGGSGFVGSHFARALLEAGHETVLICRKIDSRAEMFVRQPRARVRPIGLDDPAALAAAFAGVEAVAHCAGINRESGSQTYTRVHIDGTRNVIAAAKAVGVKRIALLSFLRARPACGSAYHESKFAAEELVRASGLAFTVLKAGVIYGRGDHMLDHLSHAFHTFPVFGLVGYQDRPVRPAAVEDVACILQAALVHGELPRQTLCVTGPEEVTLREAVNRVARVVGRRPLMLRLPLFFQRTLAWVLERTMTVPLVSAAQIRILSEGVTEPLPFCPPPPVYLCLQTRFTAEQIRRGLPPPNAFGLQDCLCWVRLRRAAGSPCREGVRPC